MRHRRRYKRPKFCVFPGYRWCGPGCSGPGAPINETDAACKAHDECYRKTR
ncbi:phospholipase, partial [Halobacillus trueperi]